jgi:hypothetical protein
MNSTEGTGVVQWRVSSYSNGEGQCVAVATAPGAVGLRDTKHAGNGPELWVSADAGRAFVVGVVSGTLSA